MSDEHSTPQTGSTVAPGRGELQARRATSGNATLKWLGDHPRAVQISIWIIVAASIGFGLFMWLTDRLVAENVGYGGAFYFNLISSAAVIIPVPGLAAVCVAAAPALGLNFALLGLAGGAGSTIGEITGYLAGYSGQGFVRRYRHFGRIHRWVSQRGWLALFILSAIPNPAFDVAGIAAGSLGYSLKKFLLFVLLGKIIKFVLIALACQQGIEWLQTIFRTEPQGG